MPGTREQDVLWRSTLPLGIDVAHKTLRFGMEHAADTTALIGASCGSPQGLPLLVSPTGEIEYLNPFDRAHRNHSIVVAGTSGTGKTHFGNRLVAHLVALGAKGYVFDRSGHYEILGRLIPGARKLDIGSEDSRYAINHWDTPRPLEPAQAEGALPGRSAPGDARDRPDPHAGGAAGPLHPLHLPPLRRQGAGPPRARAGRVHARLRRPRARPLRGSDDQTVRTLDALAGELAEFVEDGMYAHLWDRETNIPDDAPLLIFDSSGAGERMLIPLMFATMEWVRERVQRANKEAAASPVEGAQLHGRSVVLLDEGWAWSQVEELAQHIQHWARQSRHYGACFVVMSQDAKDFEGTAEAVLRNASIKLLLEQDKAMLDYLEQTVNVSPEVVKRLKDLRTVKGQYSEALVDQRRPRHGPGAAGGRPARVLGLHLRAQLRPAAARAGDRRARRQRLGRDRRACHRGGHPRRRRWGRRMSGGEAAGYPGGG